MRLHIHAYKHNIDKEKIWTVSTLLSFSCSVSIPLNSMLLNFPFFKINTLKGTVKAKPSKINTVHLLHCWLCLKLFEWVLWIKEHPNEYQDPGLSTTTFYCSYDQCQSVVLLWWRICVNVSYCIFSSWLFFPSTHIWYRILKEIANLRPCFIYSLLFQSKTHGLPAHYAESDTWVGRHK